MSKLTLQDSDQWETPQWLFDELNEEFNFDFDLCATDKNTKCHWHITDYLKPLPHYCNDGINCFMNPPYSNPLPFVQKAWEDSKRCKIVCLLKCDPSTKTFAVFWDYDNHCPKEGAQIRFIPKRLKFEYMGYPGRHAAAFPSMIVIMDRQAEAVFDDLKDNFDDFYWPSGG